MNKHKTFKNIFLNITAFVIVTGILVVTAINLPNTPPSGQPNNNGIFMKYFNSILVNSNSINTDGKVKQSATLVNKQCNSGELLQGFNSDGTKICVSNN